MSGDKATLELLIQIRDELAGLTRTRQGIKDTKHEAEGLGKLLREGFGIGSGMELARRGIDLLRDGIRETVGEAFALAREVKQQADDIGFTTDAYQVFRNELKEDGAEMGRLFMAINSQNESLAQARAGVGAAANAYKDLGLSAAEVERMTPDQRVLAVARATLSATDQTKAFSAAGQILGSRGLPSLLGALKNLSTEGYAKLNEEMKKSGRIMSEDTIERLRNAELNIEKLKQKMVISTGEIIGAGDDLRKSFSADWWHTLLGVVAAGASPMGSAYLGAVVASNQPIKPKEPAQIVAGPSNALPENVIGTQIAISTDRASAIQNNALMTEYEKRQALTPLLREQIDLYTKLAKAKFGDNFDNDRTALERKAASGNITDADLARLKEMQDIETKIRAAKLERLQNVDRPLDVLARSLNDTTGLMADTLSTSVTSAVGSLSSSIWSAAQGTGSWRDTFRGLGQIAGQVLSELIVKLLIVKPLLAMFGFGTDGAGVSAGTPKVAAAGGGSFVTSGPTNFTVGDNPGGIELVSVMPLSGIGRSTVNGQALHMAGGGQALVAGGGRSKSGGDTIYIDASNADAAGIARLETMFRALNDSVERRSLSANFEAKRRGRRGFR